VFTHSQVWRQGQRQEATDEDVENTYRNSAAVFHLTLKPKAIFMFCGRVPQNQSGKLHEAMKQFIPDALFIGFTGTPLLKSDKQTSLEVFGRYIHTYKFNEA
jgi:type I restriction enzyme R subunit